MKLSLDRAQARKQVEAFLSRHPSLPLQHYHEVEGFLFAVCCAPDVLPPSAWLDHFYGDHPPEYRDSDELSTSMEGLFSLYNAINRDIEEEAAAKACAAAMADQPLDNLAEDAPLRRWSHGFDYAHVWLHECWDACMDMLGDDQRFEALRVNVGASLMALVSFAGKERFEQTSSIMIEEGDAESEAEVAETLTAMFPDALETYAQIGRSFYRANLAAMEEEDEAGFMEEPDIGRNDPCPCGSGKKYKKCCGLG